MDSQGAANHILKRLENELPAERTYHSIGHTKDVQKVALDLAERAGVQEEELELLSTAALYHDCGFIYQSLHHEERGCELVQETLAEFGFQEAEILTVCSLIMATKVPQQPKNELEKILCDADLDYLGRDDFEEIGEHLYKEFLFDGVVDGRKSWDQLQVNFISQHRYFTNWSRENREPVKHRNLQKVKERLASMDGS